MVVQRCSRACHVEPIRRANSGTLSLRPHPKHRIETSTRGRSHRIHRRWTNVAAPVVRHSHKQGTGSDSSFWPPRCGTGLTVPISLTACWLKEGSSSSVRVVGTERVGSGIVDANDSLCVDLGWQAAGLAVLQEPGRLLRVVFSAGSPEVWSVSVEMIRESFWPAPGFSGFEP